MRPDPTSAAWPVFLPWYLPLYGSMLTFAGFNSLRVVEKLGIHEVGYAPRFLHIDGAWRDHRIFAITAEDCPGGLVTRLESQQSHE